MIGGVECTLVGTVRDGALKPFSERFYLNPAESYVVAYGSSPAWPANPPVLANGPVTMWTPREAAGTDELE